MTIPALRGVNAIRSYVPTLPLAPGVYRMLGKNQDVLYVGKARALRKRVASYTHFDRLPTRLKRMVAATETMEFIETKTELDALLLEANLIKSLRPRYNILLKDDKSYPYLALTDGHAFPRLIKHRGSRNKTDMYFGPFASSGAVFRTQLALQKAFQLRNCSDTMFASRSRPCLQYHIKRCTAPCVGRVTEADYAQQVRHVRDFLQGKSAQIQQQLADDMMRASEALDFETAAALRDKIKALSVIMAHQTINLGEPETADIVALAQKDRVACVQVFFYRQGQNYGNRSYFPIVPEGALPQDILSSFLVQFYTTHPVPPHIFVSHSVLNAPLIEDALRSFSEDKKSVTLHRPQRGSKKAILDFAVENAQRALDRRLMDRDMNAVGGQALCERLGLTGPLERIEVYDNSHLSGTNMVGAMIVAGTDGFVKTAYRKFNHRTATPGDDLAMMREMIMRRFRQQSVDTQESDEPVMPDLMIIDGGPTQLKAVLDTLATLKIQADWPIIAIAKGVDRHAGREWIHQQGRDPVQWPVDDPALTYIQRLRDEAHRFAIGAQRTRRAMGIDRSRLDEVPGIGPGRKKALLASFGSARAVADATLDDLCRVPGISKTIAETIYRFFRA